jgi:hypothetical protein
MRRRDERGPVLRVPSSGASRGRAEAALDVTVDLSLNSHITPRPAVSRSCSTTDCGHRSPDAKASLPRVTMSETSEISWRREPVAFVSGAVIGTLGGLLFGGETLDYFRLAVGPENIDNPAKSGRIALSHTENGPMFGHPANMRLRQPGSSQSSCHNQTDPAIAA